MTATETADRRRKVFDALLGKFCQNVRVVVEFVDAHRFNAVFTSTTRVWGANPNVHR